MPCLLSIRILPVIIDIERTSLAASFQNRRLFTRNNRTFGRWGGYFFWVIASKYPVATTSNTIASNSVILTHPLSGERSRHKSGDVPHLLYGTSRSKVKHIIEKAYLEHALQTGFSFYPCYPSFPLVNQRTGCYNIDKRNASGGTFPNWFQLNMKNNRSTSQGRAVISFWLSRECSLLPRRETQSRQSQTFRSPPLGGKTPPFCLRTFHVYYMVHPGRKSNILSKSLFGVHTPNRLL